MEEKIWIQESEGLDIKAELDRLQYSQIELARQIGIEQPRLSEILNGKRPVSRDVCLKIASELNLDWLRRRARGDVSEDAERERNLTAFNRYINEALAGMSSVDQREFFFITSHLLKGQKSKSISRAQKAIRRLSGIGAKALI